MDITIEFLAAFIFLQWLIRMSIAKSKLPIWTNALLVLAIMTATYDWALSTSWVSLGGLISQPSFLEHMVIVICPEGAIFTVYLFLPHTDKSHSHKALMQSPTFSGASFTCVNILLRNITAYYPGVVALAIPALLQVWLFYHLPASNYNLVHYTAMGIVAGIIVGGKGLLKRLFPKVEMRKELLFLCTLFVLLVATLALNDTRKAIPEIPAQPEFNTVVVVGLMSAVCLTGWIIHRFKNRFRQFLHLIFKQQTI